MITRIPALEFMQRIIGIYQSQDQLASLHVTRCGYGQVVEFHCKNKLQLAGVVGASGNSIELFAQLGLPNVVRMIGDLQSKNIISFKSQELPVSLVLAIDGDTLTLTVSFKDANSSHHVLQRA